MPTAKSTRLKRQDPEYRKAEVQSQIAKIQRYRSVLLNLFGNKCNCNGQEECWHESYCDVAFKPVLHLEHTAGNGEEERRTLGGYTGMIIYYYHNQEEAKQVLQLYCSNCNWAKRYRLKEHNHLTLASREIMEK